MKNYLFSFFFIFLGLPLTSHSQGLDDIRLMTENYPPFQIYDKKSGKLEGYMVEVLEAMLKKMGSKKSRSNIEVLPWARGYKLVQKQKNSMLFGMSRTKSRENLFKWVGPIWGSNQSLLALKSSNIKINSILDAKNLRIAVIRDDVGEKLLTEAGLGNSIKFRNNNLQQSFAQVKKGKADIFAYSDLGTINQLKKDGKDITEFKRIFILKKGSSWFAFHKDTPQAILDKYQDAVEKVLKDSSYKGIYKKYDIPSH